jgi:hypothetical protein
MLVHSRLADELRRQETLAGAPAALDATIPRRGAP